MRGGGGLKWRGCGRSRRGRERGHEGEGGERGVAVVGGWWNEELEGRRRPGMRAHVPHRSPFGRGVLTRATQCLLAARHSRQCSGDARQVLYFCRLPDADLRRGHGRRRARSTLTEQGRGHPQNREGLTFRKRATEPRVIEASSIHHRCVIDDISMTSARNRCIIDDASVTRSPVTHYRSA